MNLTIGPFSYHIRICPWAQGGKGKPTVFGNDVVESYYEYAFNGKEAAMFIVVVMVLLACIGVEIYTLMTGKWMFALWYGLLTVLSSCIIVAIIKDRRIQGRSRLLPKNVIVFNENGQAPYGYLLHG